MSIMDNINFAEQWQFENQLDSQICTTEEQSKRLFFILETMIKTNQFNKEYLINR